VSSAPAVELWEVERTFFTDAGTVRAVAGVSAAVQRGTSLAITGPSGCGKSTLLSLIGALDAPTAGRVVIDGEVVSEMGEEDRARLRRKSLGFVFQSDNLQPYLTAVENVSLQVALSERGRGYERSVELLSRLGLEAEADKFPDQLSGGERQRVAVGRALVHGPGLILADEPTGSLDPENSRGVFDCLRAAQSEFGATLIVITHEPALAKELDRQLVLSDGAVVHDSGPVELAVLGGADA
jgi:putative ABC transport system ATP-binding protein